VPLVTDPLSGTLLDYGRTTHDPPAGLADHVRARDLYCRAPGCRRKAADAELENITAWSHSLRCDSVRPAGDERGADH